MKSFLVEFHPPQLNAAVSVYQRGCLRMDRTVAILSAILNTAPPSGFIMSGLSACLKKVV